MCAYITVVTKGVRKKVYETAVVFTPQESAWFMFCSLFFAAKK